MAFYPYEYYCGANVVVEVDGFPCEEVAGLSYQVAESKRPLYGYSSRFFDSIARGQVLVQGSIILNYIHQDYLFRAIETGRRYTDIELNDIIDPPEGSDQSRIQASREKANTIDNMESWLDAIYLAEGPVSPETQALVEQYYDDPAVNSAFVEGMQNKFWDVDLSHPQRTFFEDARGGRPAINPHDTESGVNIRVSFGRRNFDNLWSGNTGFLLSGVYFIGRGVPIQIDEEVIVEEYSFIARNVHGVQGTADMRPAPTTSNVAKPSFVSGGGSENIPSDNIPMELRLNAPTNPDTDLNWGRNGLWGVRGIYPPGYSTPKRERDRGSTTLIQAEYTRFNRGF